MQIVALAISLDRQQSVGMKEGLCSSNRTKRAGYARLRAASWRTHALIGVFGKSG